MLAAASPGTAIAGAGRQPDLAALMTLQHHALTHHAVVIHRISCPFLALLDASTRKCVAHIRQIDLLNTADHLILNP